MEDFSQTPKQQNKNKNFKASKLIIIFLVIGVAISLVLAFLFYNQSENWQDQFGELAEGYNRLANKILAIDSFLQEDDMQESFMNEPKEDAVAVEDEKQPLEEKFSSSGEVKELSREAMIILAVEEANPAVVSIIVSKDMPKLELYYENPFGDDPFFENFNFKIPRYRQKGTEKRQIGAGTGFIVSKGGLIVTNKHVVSQEEAEYTVLLSDGDQYTAKILARDPLNDIAFAKVEGKDFPSLTLGDSDKIKLGQTVIAIGNALGEFQNSVSTGIVSGMKRSITAGNRYGQAVEQLENVIQTDAAINPGNSGGPLLNLQGEVIGVNVAVASAENIGFSLPVNDIKKRLKEVEEHGRIMRPMLGLRYILINNTLKEELELSVDYGALIARGQTEADLAVIPGGPADKAGVKEGDIILEINAVKITVENNLSKILIQYSVGDEIGLRVLRDGEEMIVKVVLEEMKA